MSKEGHKIKEIKLLSSKDSFPIRVKFLDKYDNVVDYILCKTSNEKLLLQNPIFDNNNSYQ